MSNIVKDFYNRLPGAYVSELDKIVDKYKDELWFADAWMGYRIHIINSTKDKIKSPTAFFSRWTDRVPNAKPENKYEAQAELYTEGLACCPPQEDDGETMCASDTENGDDCMEASDCEPDLVASDLEEPEN